jgi:hypothetical protein
MELGPVDISGTGWAKDRPNAASVTFAEEIQAAIAGPSRARFAARGGTGVADACGKAPTDGLNHPFGTDGAAWIGSPAVAGPWLSGTSLSRSRTRRVKKLDRWRRAGAIGELPVVLSSDLTIWSSRFHLREPRPEHGCSQDRCEVAAPRARFPRLRPPSPARRERELRRPVEPDSPTPAAGRSRSRWAASSDAPGRHGWLRHARS